MRLIDGDKLVYDLESAAAAVGSPEMINAINILCDIIRKQPEVRFSTKRWVISKFLRLGTEKR